MAKYIHIVSVGASILSNYASEIKEGLPQLGNDKEYEKYLNNKEFMDSLIKFVEMNPYSASAEINALRLFLEENKINEIYFIVTDTNVGKICAEVLSKYLRGRRKIETNYKQIPGYYSYMERRDLTLEEVEEYFTKGLSELRDKLLEFIHNKQKDPQNIIMINATGGFKPEVVILWFVGSLKGIQVYYIHEFFKRPVILPPLVTFEFHKEDYNAIKMIYEKETKRVVGKDLIEFNQKYGESKERLVNQSLIKEKIRADGALEGYIITPYGKFMVETLEKMIKK